MTHSPESGHGRNATEVLSSRTLWVTFGAVASIIATFFVAVSTAGLGVKAAGVFVIISTFLLMVLVLAYIERHRSLRASSDEIELGRVLCALDAAGQYFSRSLTPADALRLITGQIGVIVPVSWAAVYLAEGGGAVKAAAAFCTDEEESPRDDRDRIPDVVRRSMSNGHVCYEQAGRGRAEGQMVAVPLLRDGGVFGVFAMKIGAVPSGKAVRPLFDSIGERITPLVLSSLSFERSRATAMTDAMTELPNERAFYLILENQIAETQRNVEARPLSVLAIDVPNFHAISQRYGHAAGDRILNFVGCVVRENLRQMDFFARSGGSEFLAVLPTATREMSQEIAARIHAGFAGCDLEVADGYHVEVELDIGCASFGVDGETAPQMLSVARGRREQAASPEPATILRFPSYESRL